MSTDRTKVALVTGASSGIGYELTKQLVSKLGYKVYAAARRVEKIEELENLYGKEKVVAVKLDVSDYDAILALKERLSRELAEQKLDLLFNNAGQSCTFPAIDVSNANIEQVFKVNVFAPMNMTREFSPFLINAANTPGGGCIPVVAFTGSLAGVCPFPFGSVYGSSKAAIHQYARTAHLELKAFGVKVLNVVTGGVDTDIADTRDLPENSVYNFKEGLDAFHYRQQMSHQNSPMPCDEYCAHIIKDISKLQSSGYDPVDVYRGARAVFMRIFSLLVPYVIVDYIFMYKFKLYALFRALSKKPSSDQKQVSSAEDSKKKT